MSSWIKVNYKLMRKNKSKKKVSAGNFIKSLTINTVLDEKHF